MNLVEIEAFSVEHGQLRFEVATAFSLQAGEVLCLLCEEDARPSDFLHALTGLDAFKRVTMPAGGQELIRQPATRKYSNPVPVRIKSRPIHGIPTLERARLIAFVFDNPELAVLGSTVAEEFRYSAAALGDDPQLPSVHSLEPYGLYDKLDRSTAVLSGGERHRLAIACAMERECALLVLDLTRSNLDAEFEDWLFSRLSDWFTLRSRNSGAAVIMAGVDPLRLQNKGIACRRGFLGAGGLFSIDSEGQNVAPTLPTLNERIMSNNITAWTKGLGRRGCMRRQTLDLHGGEILAFHGPNGCGKTSLAMLLAGRERDQNFEGDYGVSPGVRPALALQYAERSLLGPTVAAELGNDPVVSEILDFRGEALQQHPRELPYSRQKLLSSAAALRAAHGTVILDEPSCGMDAASRASFVRLLNHYQATSVLVFTHDPVLQKLFRSTEFGS